VIGLEVKLVEQKQGKSTIENFIALIWGAWNLNVVLDHDIKANLTIDESENVRGINHSQFRESNKQSITFYDPNKS
jgi:hypothetical protein